MLELGVTSLSFEPDTSDTSGNVTINFFDFGTQTICTLRNNGGLGLTCKSLETRDVVSTRTKNKGATELIKLFPNKKMAIFRRDKKSIDIVYMYKKDANNSIEFNIPIKSSDSFIDVNWVNDCQILLISEQCLELVTINEDKGSYKFLKSTNISVSWCIYYAPSNLCLLATGNNNATLQPITVHHSQFVRFKSFEVDLGLHGNSSHDGSGKLLEPDVSIASLYGHLYAIVTRYSSRSSTSTDLALYQLSSDPNVPSKLKCVLCLGFNSGFGINIIDNLVIVHHQPEARSLVFDISLSSSTSHLPVITTEIKPHGSCITTPELYTPQWSIFQPDIITDRVTGIMYKLTIENDQAVNLIEDKFTLLRYLIHRSDSHSIVLSTLLECILNRDLTQRQLGKIFNFIVEYNQFPKQSPSKSHDNCKMVPSPYKPLKIEQRDLLSAIFIPLKDDNKVNKKYVSNVMLQFLRCLHKMNVIVDEYFLELLVQTLVEAKEMATLHQLVTYRVITDLKPLATLLLSYEARCKQLFQSGVDILCRQRGIIEIVEVMLEKGLVVDALRFLEAQPVSVNYSQAKLLECASRCNRIVHYAIVTHLVQKKGEQVDTTTLYKQDEIEAAERDCALNVLYD